MGLIDAPQNTDSKSVLLSVISAAGALGSAYAAYSGIGNAEYAEYFIWFYLVSFGLYGTGFFLAPALLIDMNFSAIQDKYHSFMGRMTGFCFLILCYIWYSDMEGDQATTFKLIGITAGGVGLLGPTTAGLYLEPKQTPMGHMPAHFLFLPCAQPASPCAGAP